MRPAAGFYGSYGLEVPHKRCCSLLIGKAFQNYRGSQTHQTEAEYTYAVYAAQLSASRNTTPIAQRWVSLYSLVYGSYP